MIMALTGAALPALAAVPPTSEPGAVQQRTQHTRQYYQNRQLHPQPTKPANPVLNKKKPAGQAKGQKGPSFELKAIKFSPSHFFSKAALEKIAQPYIGRTVTVADLHKLVAKINKRYTDKNIYTARAVLPPQRIRHGVVRIELIEGKLGQIKIEKNRYTRNSFLRARIQQEKGQVVDGKRLKKNLVYFNRTSDIRLRALMRPGESKGLTQILLLAQEPPRFQISPFADDAGSKSTGRYRGGLSFEVFDPFGIDDRFDGYFVGSRGEQSGFASYSVPVNHLNGRIGMSYSRNAINIVRGPFKALDITGYSQDVGLDFTQPFLVTTHWKATWASSIAYSESETDASGVKFASSKIERLSTGLTLVHNADRHQWSTTQTLSGIHSQQTLDHKHDFFVYSGQASYLQVFGKSAYSALLTVGGQYSPAKLLPSQSLFQVGGVGSVRGYVPGVVAGDGGFFGQLEIHRRLFKWFDAFAFVDGGAVYQTFPKSRYVYSAGPGLAFHWGNWLTGSVDAGFPLETVTPNRDDYRVDFRVALHWSP